MFPLPAATQRQLSGLTWLLSTSHSHSPSLPLLQPGRSDVCLSASHKQTAHSDVGKHLRTSHFPNPKATTLTAPRANSVVFPRHRDVHLAFLMYHMHFAFKMTLVCRDYQRSFLGFKNGIPKSQDENGASESLTKTSCTFCIIQGTISLNLSVVLLTPPGNG